MGPAAEIGSEMLESIEGESVNEDELFGSGPATWNQSSDLSLRLPQRSARDGNPAMVYTENQIMNHLPGGEPAPQRNIPQAPSGSNVMRPRPVRSDVSVNQAQAGPSQEVNATGDAREPVVRNKTTKNKENKIKNVNQRRQHPDVTESTRNIQEETSQAASFRPVLQVKRNDIQSAERTRNSVKQEKQSKNNSIAALGLSENIPNGYSRDTSHLLMNGINPNENPRNITQIYVRHSPNTVQAANQPTNRIDSTEYSIGGAELSLDNEENETTVKRVDKNNIRQIQNDLWGRHKQQNSNISLDLQAPSLDFSFANGLSDLETDEVPNRSPAVIQTSPAVSQSHNLMQNPIVLQYDSENSTSPCNNQIHPALFIPNNGLTLSLSSSGHVSPHVVTTDSLSDSVTMPSTCLFGDGTSDSLYAQRLQQFYRDSDRDMDSELMARGADIVPDHDQFRYHDNLHHEHPVEPDFVPVQRIHNDLYEPGEEDHSCTHFLIPYPYGCEPRRERVSERTSINPVLPEPDVVRIEDGHILSDQFYRESGPHMPRPYPTSSGELTPDYGVAETMSRDEGRQGTEDMDDELFARLLQEQLNTEDDAVYARYLQDMENDDRYRDRYRGHRDQGTHQPLHTRYGRTWSRPLRVGHETSSSHNVVDSRVRGQRTWDRPLQQRGGNHGGSDFAYLDAVRDLPVREGYDIPPSNYYPNEFDPDYIVDDRGEDYLVSININRDPHMLASLLMERAPDMMVPNDIDMNDYEALWELAEGLGEVRRVGMEQAEISLLPVHTYQAAARGDSEGSKTDCLVCLNTFSQGDQLRTLPCCHIYHVDCIDEWLKRNAICPVCRQSAKQGEH